jgi:hypothetical protein
MRIPKALNDWAVKQHLQLGALTPAQVTQASAATGLPAAKISAFVDEARASNQLTGASATQAVVPQRDVFAAPIKVANDYAYTKDGAAYTEFRVQGSSLEEVKAMILNDNLSNFAGGSSIKVGDTPGRYAFNPLGGPPGTLRDIQENPDGSLALTLRGPIHGGGHVEISAEPNGDVMIREQGIRYQPDLRFIPGAGQMEAMAEMVPFFGALPKMFREGMEGIAGAPLAELHVMKAKNGDLCATLERGLAMHRQNSP